MHFAFFHCIFKNILRSKIQLLNKGPTFGLSIGDLGENSTCFELPNY
jgi:hypothetical protein